MSSTAVVVLGTVLVNLLVALGGFYAARQSRKATDGATAVDRQVAQSKDREVLVNQLSEQLDKLWPRLEAMDKTIDAQRDAADIDRERIRHLETENGQLRHDASRAGDHLEKFGARLDDYVARYRSAILYVVQLRSFMEKYLPVGIVMPLPPEGLMFDLADPVESTKPLPDGWPQQSK